MPQLNHEQRQRLFNYFSEAHDMTLMEDDFRMIDDLICSQNSAKLSVSGSLELLAQEYNRLNDASPANMSNHEKLKRVIRMGHCGAAIELIIELSANDH